MKNVKLFEEFHQKPDVLFRNTDFGWLKDFLKKGSAVPTDEKEFISFSKDENSGMGDNDVFGNIRIDFDAAMLNKQGGQEIEYSEAYFKKHPNICLYVTDYNSENDYDKWVNSLLNPKKELSWPEFLKSFSNEKEVIFTKVVMKPELIKKVTVWDAKQRKDLPEIKALCKKYKINVEIPWEDED